MHTDFFLLLFFPFDFHGNLYKIVMFGKPGLAITPNTQIKDVQNVEKVFSMCIKTSISTSTVNNTTSTYFVLFHHK